MAPVSHYIHLGGREGPLTYVTDACYRQWSRRQ